MQEGSWHGILLFTTRKCTLN